MVFLLLLYIAHSIKLKGVVGARKTSSLLQQTQRLRLVSDIANHDKACKNYLLHAASSAECQAARLKAMTY